MSERGQPIIFIILALAIMNLLSLFLLCSGVRASMALGLQHPSK